MRSAPEEAGELRQPPPKPIRRWFVAPLAFLGALVITLLSPLIHIVTAILDLLFDWRRRRFSRLVGLGLAFCVAETFSLFAAFTTWLGSGFGLFFDRPFWVRAHTVLMGQWLEMITRAIRFYLGYSFELEPFEVGDGPRILLSRHAGPGDALMVARVVVRDHGRHLHMLGTTKLMWDPFFDILGERLGFHYVGYRGAHPEDDLAAIQRLSASLGSDDTLIIFPEGGNYTPRRREASLQHFERSGRHDRLMRAAALRHTLPPRSGAVLAALDGARDAVVVMVAHTGLEGLYSLKDLWNTIPLRRRCRAKAWVVPVPDEPATPEVKADWLWRHWAAVDRWIDDRHQEAATGP